jgi:hypothetical protein
MGRNLLLSKGGQAGIKADFFILDTNFSLMLFLLKIDRAFRQIHLRPFFRIFGPVALEDGLFLMLC